ncbi:MAG TPA: YtxH domain-containing protein [Pyrinomonadaceae bacterium]|nr:YtxH domain-containing protein [Pyrinomonadaceae bacterium]
MGDDYRSSDNISSKLAYVLIGGGIGAILALLFAPKSGHELRGDIADATRKGMDRSREAAQQLGDRAGEYYEATRGRAAELYSQAAERVTDAAQGAREAASRQTGTLTAAIDAGKKAYQDEKRKTEMSGRIEAPNYGEKSN